MGNKFMTILSRTGREVSAARAERFSRRGEQAARRVIMTYEAERDALAEAIDSAMDINTSNDRNSINAIESFDADAWATKMIANRIKLRVTNEKLQEAVKVYDEFFVDGFDEATGEIITSPSKK